MNPAASDDDAPLTPEERARLLAELEAEFEAAERSIREEGTLSAEEFLNERRAYWTRTSKKDEVGGEHR